MPTLAEIRRDYPQYGDMTDSALADALYSKSYSDIPRSEFDKKIGLETKPKSSVFEAIARGLASGITFNFADELAGLMAASGYAEVMPHLEKDLDKSDAKAVGQKIIEIYKQQRDTTRAAQNTAQSEHPIAYLGGQVAGGAALPVGTALQAATLPARMARGAVTGAAYGGLSGAGEGEDLQSRVTGAAIGTGVGAAVGAVAPAVVSGVGKAGEAIINNVQAIKNPSGVASKKVGEAIVKDVNNSDASLTPSQFVAEKAAGSPVSIADLGGESVGALARSAANVSPEARATLQNFANERFSGQSDRAAQFIGDLTGTNADAGAMEKALEKAARLVNKEAYDTAHAASLTSNPNGLWDEGFKQFLQHPDIQDAAKKVLRATRGALAAAGREPMKEAPIKFVNDVPILTDEKLKPNSRFWEDVYKYSRDTVTELYRKGRTSEAGDLKDVVTALKAHLDTLVPELKDARAGASKFFGAENALDAGRNFVTGKVDINDARRAFNGMTDTERELFRFGFASDYVSKVVNKLPDNADIVKRLAQSKDARARLDLALGSDGADRVSSFLSVEAAMNRLRDAVTKNSTTTRQLVELGLATSVGGAGEYFSDPNAAVHALTVYALARGQRAVSQRIANKVADMLVSNDPKILMQGVELVNKSEVLSRKISAIANGALVPASAAGGSNAGLKVTK